MLINDTGYNIAPFADLRGADLHGADLHGAHLHGATLYGAKLGDFIIETLIARAHRIDYEFFLFISADNCHIIRAGCRTFTIDQYRAHIIDEYPNTLKARQTTLILDYFERCLEEHNK